MNKTQQILKEREEEFDRVFIDSQCNCVLDGHRKDEYCPSRTTVYNFDYDKIKSFLATSLSEAYKLGIEKGIEQAIELSDKIESQASHTEFNEWRAFKGIRNALRDFLTKSNE